MLTVGDLSQGSLAVGGDCDVDLVGGFVRTKGRDDSAGRSIRVLPASEVDFAAARGRGGAADTT
ncbi:hypothetical protein [Streptomyces sp. NPDC002133]|uniref:hypothetical protein n=1 Tax=Streptomyces sp. NPDC002133 TaxID=3154409 RepID=UPI00331C9385